MSKSAPTPPKTEASATAEAVADMLVTGAFSADVSGNEPAAAPAEPAAAPAGNPFTAQIGKRAWIVAVHGDMVNLHTNERFTSDPKKTKIDEFIASQLEAGKMALHVEEE